ncbi:alpha/beta hydrolase [Nocardioides anomalus]|uniref:Alpha/beta hydrolase n=1 Tax=Nocardioides anomalus TaxID=2712223 RepID=A0A6G6WHX2_9ACTN|nr:alpha/beta hydrolase [Nocardioides anomalus]QIG44695.1 alpha/beta hydrolase [Nocardioides anomalus]
MRTRAHVERLGVRAVTALPAAAQRRLAGRPVRLDGNTLATDLQLLLRLQRAVRAPDPATVPVPRGRALVRETAWELGGRQPVGEVRSLRVADLPARLYVPDGAPARGPLLVFFHGGGFWAGDLDSHDAACRFLCREAGVRVLSVEYRQGPEHPFPAAHDDAVAAYGWTLEHAGEVGADLTRLGVGGDSAGGNLAAHVAIEAARSGWPCAVQLLVYPATLSRRDTPSSRLFAHGFYLTEEFMDRATLLYARSTPPDEPRLSPLHAELPAGLAPALVHTAGFDPLRDEGEAYADKLRAAGVEVRATRFPDQIHAFLNIVGVPGTSRSAVRRIARELATSLG